MKALEAGLPAEAREYRIGVYEARRGMDAKASHRPLERILWPKWEELGLQDVSALRSYLEERHGSGRYYLEPQDAHNRRLDRLPAWTITTDEDEDMDEYDDDDHPRRRGGGGWHRRSSGRRRPYVDDYDDDDDPILAGNFGADPVAERASIADLLTVQAKQAAAEKEAASKGQSDMMSTILLLQSQQAEAQRRADEKREEQMREERRLEREREERRREEENRRWEEKLEERRREEARQAEQTRIMMEASNKKTETMVALVTAGLPLIQKLFEPKSDPVTQALLAKTTEEKGTDPVMMMLLKNMLDKQNGNESMQQMIASMGEMSRMSSQLMTEQMKNMLTTTNDLNSQVIKRALDLAMDNPHATDEDKGMLGQIVEALGSASSLVDAFGGGKQPPQQGAHLPPQQQHPQHPPQPHSGDSQQPQGATQGDQVPAQSSIPQPRGIEAVGGVMMAVYAKAYSTEQEYQQLISFMLSEMPDNLRQAVAAGDESSIIEICTPAFLENAELRGWITTEGVADWIRAFLQQLQPLVAESMGMVQQPQPASGADLPEGSEGGDDTDDGAHGEGSDDDDDDDGDDPV